MNGNHQRQYFRVTKWMEKEKYLSAWIEHFRRKKIACIIEERKGKYALWRIGVESTDNPRVEEVCIGKVTVAYDPGGKLCKLIAEGRKNG